MTEQVIRERVDELLGPVTNRRQLLELREGGRVFAYVGPQDVLLAGDLGRAVRAAREGLSVLLVNHTRHLGGFITSGAGCRWRMRRRPD